MEWTVTAQSDKNTVVANGIETLSDAASSQLKEALAKESSVISPVDSDHPRDGFVIQNYGVGDTWVTFEQPIGCTRELVLQMESLVGQALLH